MAIVFFFVGEVESGNSTVSLSLVVGVEVG